MEEYIYIKNEAKYYRVEGNKLISSANLGEHLNITKNEIRIYREVGIIRTVEGISDL